MRLIRKLTIRKTGMYILAGILSWCPNVMQGQSGNILGEHAEFHFRTKILDSECKPLIAKNETPADVTIEKISLAPGSDFFALSDLVNMPMRLSPNESVSLGYICFRPTIAEKEYKSTVKIEFAPAGHPADGTVNLYAKSFGDPVVANVPPTSPGAIISFDPATIKNGTLLSMVGKDEEFFRSFTFKNVSSKTITVSSFDFQKQDARFDVSSVEPGGGLPIDVAPGESFTVRIAYHSVERTPSFNTLLIYTEDSKEPVRYDVRGLQMPLSQMDWNKHNGTATSQGK